MKTLFTLLLFPFVITSATAQYRVNGSSSQMGSDCFSLSPDITWQNGSVWATQQINLNYSFELYTQIFLGCNDSGADGMVFVLQNIDSTIMGGNAGGLGYTGITPSLGVEIDTWPNGSAGDPSYDHIALISNGSINHSGPTNLAGPVMAHSTLANIEDCNTHELHISWNPLTDSLKIYVDCVMRVSYQIDIANQIFGGSPLVYWGFTGTTGALSNAQEFCIDYLSTGFEASVCENDSFQLSVGNGVSYSWSPATGLNNPSSAAPTALPDTSTTYTVTITDNCGNIRQESFSITIIPDTSLNCSGPLLQAVFGEAKVEQIDRYRIGGWFQTVSEMGSEYFTVSRSTDLNSWISIDTILAIGEENITTHYSFTDEYAYEAGSDIIYYQIKEFDGYSSTVFPKQIQVDFQFNQPLVRVYPNPASDNIQISLSGADTPGYSYSIYSSLGQFVESRKIVGRDFEKVDISRLRAGSYRIVIRFDSSRPPVIKGFIKV